jgi:GT2 family glycosyltransferase
MGRHLMKISEKPSIAVAVSDFEVLYKNLCLSPGVRKKEMHQLILKSGYSSASHAYNEAIEEAASDIIIFVHQDVYLTEGWFSSLRRAIDYLEQRKINWGVLGCFGSSRSWPGGVGRVYTTGRGLHGNEIDKPEAVETVDEIVIIIRKSSGLHFDPSLPYFHLYGTDICMSAREKGMECFAIPAFCIHNTNQLVRLPREFYECYYHIRKRWRKSLPIFTSCMKVSRFNEDVYIRKVREFVNNVLGKTKVGQRRSRELRKVLEMLQAREKTIGRLGCF